ncbi:hypothetical protein Dda_3764 [Drechslerella dactyloides]|uniref:GST N-terminal domain-containing protein n=1 Tax=Drechslerella dactyloides TaxID=74499 RepID=A0AAD6NJU4_DREDA|nr:hypothetical protein Dda_3764 [Drechslerella dactyloides]
MSTKYTLFDIPTKSNPPMSWSPNVWKARGVLNYKNVPYETEWIEYPDIRVRLAAMGLPSKGGLMPYTLPMLRATITPADGSEPQIKYLTDSADIAKYINDQHPEPAVDFDHEINEEALELLVNTLRDPYCGVVLCEIPNVLSERSAAYVHETRPIWMGMPIADFKKKKIEEGAWANLETGIGKLRELLRRNEGPFLLGEKPSFGDIAIIGYMIWARESGPEAWAKIKEVGGKEVKDLMEAAEEKKITTRATY